MSKFYFIYLMLFFLSVLLLLLLFIISFFLYSFISGTDEVIPSSAHCPPLRINRSLSQRIIKLFRISQQQLINVDIAKSSTFPNTFF